MGHCSKHKYFENQHYVNVRRRNLGKKQSGFWSCSRYLHIVKVEFVVVSTNTAHLFYKILTACVRKLTISYLLFSSSNL